jgi:beta-carotene hydroxylase
MVLRNAADVRTLVFVLLYFIFTGFAWYFFHSMPTVVAVFAVIGLCFWSFFCAVIVHNTIHTPLFRKKYFNKAFQLLLSLTYGYSVSVFVIGHNLSHHQHLASDKDIARTSIMRFRWNLLNQLLFFFMTGSRIVSSEVHWSRKMFKENPRWFWQYAFEIILVYGLKVTLLLVDWKLALLLVWLPHFYAQWGIIGTNFWQHDGCDPEHPYNHSRNFTNPVLNYFTFNNGYHGLHHNQPTLHWSMLPEVYEKEFKPHLHPNLDRNSLLKYLIEAYLWPGRRLDYTNAPVVLDPPVPDNEDWIRSVNTKTQNKHLGAEP